MFNGLVLTKLGKIELIKATDEGSLNFTHIAFGDGVTDDVYSLKDDLSHEVTRLAVTEVERQDDKIILSLDYTNRSFEKGFYFRELGIIANEKLCYYDNSGSDAEYIDPANTVVTKEKRLRIELMISDSVTVETTVDSKLYALKTDLVTLWSKFVEVIKKQLGDHIVKKDVPENAVFTDTWLALKGATASVDGSAGYAPAPPKGEANRYLRSDGTWAVPPDTQYTHPAYTARSSGLYKITVDGRGHISDVAAVTKEDITALGIPGQDTNTTYGAATQSANGLMSAADKKKLDGVATGANAYIHPAYTARSSGLYKITVDGSGHISSVTAVTKADITALGIPGQDTNTWRGIVNNLTSTDTNQSLSAAQGKVLSDKITALNSSLSNRLKLYKTINQTITISGTNDNKIVDLIGTNLNQKVLVIGNVFLYITGRNGLDSSKVNVHDSVFPFAFGFGNVSDMHTSNSTFTGAEYGYVTNGGTQISIKNSHNIGNLVCKMPISLPICFEMTVKDRLGIGYCSWSVSEAYMYVDLIILIT